MSDEDESVKVKLTDRGEEILKCYEEEWRRVFPSLDLPPKLTTKQNEEGWREFKLLDLLTIFENHLDKDAPVLFTELEYIGTADT